MNTTFDERERAFESRFAHEEELRFQARAAAIACWRPGRPSGCT